MTSAETLVETPPQQAACPQCGSAEPWGGNSWCPDCGFYPKFAEGDSAPANPAADEQEEEVEQGMPDWAKVLIAGIVIILVGSLGMRTWVHFNGGQRAWVALFEMIIGFGCAGTASTLALIRRQKADRNLSFFDAITNPVGIWRPILEEMPKTQKLVWFGSWGITMVIAANVCVGGIKYSGVYTNDWGFEQPKKKRGSLVGAIAEVAAEKAGSETDDLMQQLDEFVAAKKAGLPAKPPTVKAYVYGYLADDSSETGRILVARRLNGKLKHCAVIRGSDLNEKTHEVLLRMANERRTDYSTVSSSLNARWVKPTIELKLTFEGFASNGELLKPSFHSLDVLEKKTTVRKRKRTTLDEALKEGDAEKDVRPPISG